MGVAGGCYKSLWTLSLDIWGRHVPSGAIPMANGELSPKGHRNKGMEALTRYHCFYERCFWMKLAKARNKQ